MNQGGGYIDPAAEYLRDWAYEFLKNKDLILRRIESMEIHDDIILIKLREGYEQGCLIAPFIEDLSQCFSKLERYSHATLIAYNTEENYNALLKDWDKMAAFKRQFNLHFVNPFSAKDKQWGIFPYTHQLITQGEGLKTGLSALRSNVDVITKETIIKKINENKR